MSKRTIYLICIPFLAIALVVGGGWWANRAGLLGQWLAPVAQTASSVSAGVEAQPGQPGRAGQTGAITGTMTMTMPLGGGANGFPPPGMGAPITATVPLSGTTADSAPVMEPAAESASAPAATEKVAAIPAVAGVSRRDGRDGS